MDDGIDGTTIGRRQRLKVAPVSSFVRRAAARTDDPSSMPAVRPEFAAMVLGLGALAAVAWAFISLGPAATWGLTILAGTTVILDVLAGDVLRAGRRLIAPGLAIGVATFVLFGAPAAVIVGLARGVVRVLTPRPLPRNESACIVGTAVLGPLLAGLCASALRPLASAAWAPAAIYIIAAYIVEAGGATLLLSRVSRPSLRLSFEQTFGWTMLHFAALGALGAWLGFDLAAGRWMSLAYFAIPIAVIRHGFDVFHTRAEQYVAALEHENTQLFDKIGQIDRVTGDLAETVGMAIDCREGIDQDHSHRVARLATAVGTHLGMGAPDIETLRRGALLHDVGTLAIPGEIFAKPGPLTPNERRRMQLHTEFGARLVAKWRDCRALADIIEQHHERLDGSGYPRGLRGDQIILEARIVGAVEAYVALTSDRPYRSAYTPEAALRILRERTPAEYDPVVIDGIAQVAAQRAASIVPLPVRRPV